MNKAKWLKIGGLTGAVLLVFAVSLPVVAQSDQTSDQSDAAALQVRLTQRKTQLKTRLTAAQQARIKNRCKATQGLLVSFDARIKTVESNRVNAYDTILDHLNSLTTRVGDKADTTDLQAQIAVLNSKVEAFKTDFTAYRQAVEDLHTMDCGADPAAFQASLESAKASQAQLRTEVMDIRAHITDMIKPALAALRAQLKQKQGQGIN